MGSCEVEDTGVLVEVDRCPKNRSWSCPQDVAKDRIPAHCSVDDCQGRLHLIPYEEWLAKSGEIQPIFIGSSLYWTAVSHG